MSAAEKLKALDAMIHYDRGPAGRPTELRVLNALPQIVAVVEAAVNAEDMLRMYASGVDLISTRHALFDALAALDSALGAVT